MKVKSFNKTLQVRLPMDLFEKFRAKHPHMSERVRYLIESDLLALERKKRSRGANSATEANHAPSEP